MKLVDNKIAKERLLIFQKKANEIKINYRKSLYYKKALVLFENHTKDKNRFFGRDEYLNPVIVDSMEDLKGKIRETIICNGNQNTLFGEIVQNKVSNSSAA